MILVHFLWAKNCSLLVKFLSGSCFFFFKIWANLFKCALNDINLLALEYRCNITVFFRFYPSSRTKITAGDISILQTSFFNSRIENE